MSVKYPSKVIINEVGPRDGLQNESQTISLEHKLNLVNSLIKSGLTSIEVGSFVSPKWVPQMSDSGKLIDALQLNCNRELVLAPCSQHKGLDGSNIKNSKIAIFASPSETLARKY